MHKRNSYYKFTTSLTYSEITVEIAAPPMPKPNTKISIGSSTALSKLPAPDNPGNATVNSSYAWFSIEQ